MVQSTPVRIPITIEMIQTITVKLRTYQRSRGIAICCGVLRTNAFVGCLSS